MAVRTIIKPELTISINKVNPATAFATGGDWKNAPIKRKIDVTARPAVRREAQKRKKYCTPSAQKNEKPLPASLKA
jgi:hypothetical protein